MSNKRYRRVAISPILDNLIQSDAIVKCKSATAIIEDIIEAHYTNGTLKDKKLNWLIAQISDMTGKTPPPSFLKETTLYDIPQVPLSEIKASRFNKKKYVKKERPTIAAPAEIKKVDIFNPKSFE